MVRLVTDLEATLQRRTAAEFGRRVEEVVDFATIGPVGIGEDFARVADRNAIAQGRIGDVARRLGQVIAVQIAVGGAAIDEGVAGGRTHARAADRHEGVLVADFGEVVAAAHGQVQVIERLRLQIAFQAIADRLVHVDQAGRVADAADSRQLQIVGVPVIGRQVEADHVGDRALDAAFIGDGGLLLGDRGDAEEGHAVLDRRALIAGGDAAIEVHVGAERIGGADVPGQVAALRGVAERQVDADQLRRDAAGGERRIERDRVALVVVRITHAGTQRQGRRHLGFARGEQADILVGVVVQDRTHPVAREIIGIFVILQALVEEIGARLQADAVHVVRREAEFLAEFLRLGHAAGVGVERADAELAGGAAGIGVAAAAIDVAGAFDAGLLIAGGREEGAQAVDMELHAQIAAALLHRLAGIAVQVHMILVEAVDEMVAALLEDVGAEHARAAVQVTIMTAQHRLEVAGFIGQLHTAGHVAIAFQLAGGVAAFIVVLDPVVATLEQARHAEAEAVGDRAADRGFSIDGVVGGPGGAGIAGEMIGRRGRGHLDDARRGVAAEQRALRAAQHFNAGKVEHREALEHRIFERDIVEHDRDRLGGVGIEIGVAKAADVEAREGAAERAFDLKAGRARGEEANVEAAAVERVELFAADGGHGDRHVLGIFSPARGGDDDFTQAFARCGGRFGLGMGGTDRRQSGECDGERAARNAGEDMRRCHIWPP